MKESQRQLIWQANKMFNAAYEVGLVAVNDQSFQTQANELERQAHQLVRAAGYPDGPTFELSAWCAQVCTDYESGRLQVS